MSTKSESLLVRPQKETIKAFVGGLEDEIAAEIQMFKPKTLHKTIELAKMRDERLSRKTKSSKTSEV